MLGGEVALLLSKKIERDPKRLCLSFFESGPRFGENALLTLVNLWRSETRCVKDIMKEFRAVQKGKDHYDKKTRKMRKPEEIIMHDSFRKKMNALQVNLKSQRV